MKTAKLQTQVETRIGEPVCSYMQRKAEQGKTIRDVSNQLDVSYTTCCRWKNKYAIRFTGKNAFKEWRL